jgi:uncharacterized membrane protein
MTTRSAAVVFIRDVWAGWAHPATNIVAGSAGVALGLYIQNPILVIIGSWMIGVVFGSWAERKRKERKDGEES